MQKTHPSITLKTLGDNSDWFEIRQGRVKRDHLDETWNSHGYMCQPVGTAGLHGWEFVLKQDVKFIWDGISDTSDEHVKILEGGVDSYGNKFADTLTANATISFTFNMVIETDKDHYVLLTGAPNYFIDGVQPMTAILQSDWYTYNAVNFCWKITRANEEITIPAGTPFMFMMNYPRNLLESTKLEVRKLNEEEHNRLNVYNEKRDSFYKNNEPWKWNQFYKHGIESDDVKHIEKPFKPSPSEVIDNRCPHESK